MFKKLMKLRPKTETRKRNLRQARPVRPSRAVELWYLAQLSSLVKRLQALTLEHLVPALATRGVTADAADPVDAAFKAMARELGGIGKLAARLANEAARRNLAHVDEALTASIQSAVGIDVKGLLTNTPKLASRVEAAKVANVELIKSIPAEHFDKLRAAVAANVNSGMRQETLIAEVQRIGGVTQSRAKLIARDQTAKMNSSFAEIRQTSLGIERYTWQGADDERERDTHRANNGKTFRWDDPPAETGHPGNDINCRCVAIPVFE